MHAKTIGVGHGVLQGPLESATLCSLRFASGIKLKNAPEATSGGPALGPGRLSGGPDNWPLPVPLGMCIVQRALVTSHAANIKYNINALCNL